jgi:TonB family protein
MNSAPAESQPWSWRKWWGVVLGLFGLQALLLVWFGARGPVKPRPVSPSPQLKLASAAARGVLALSDPTLFAQGHARGFSGAGWMTIPAPEYQPPEWTEPPRWLALDSQQLGGDFRRFVQTHPPLIFSFARKSEPALATPEPPESPTPTAAPGTFRVEGALAGRRLLGVPSLQRWENPDLLGNSVVRVLVDSDGNVVSHVLLASSGRPDADTNALALARAARFEPLRPDAPASMPVAPLVWGTLVFAWQTLPVPTTNGLPARP